MIRDRAELLIAAVLGSSRDPFRFSELDRGMTARLDEEASALSLTGGRRVVRVREAREAAAVPVKAVLAGKAEALVILEAPGLSTRVEAACSSEPRMAHLSPAITKRDKAWSGQSRVRLPGPR